MIVAREHIRAQAGGVASEVNLRQVGAVGKRGAANIGDALSDRDADQVGAGSKCIGSDDGDCVGNGRVARIGVGNDGVNKNGIGPIGGSELIITAVHIGQDLVGRIVITPISRKELDPVAGCGLQGEPAAACVI